MSTKPILEALESTATVEGPYTFPLPKDALIHIGGIPYRHLGGGLVAGGTSPEYIHDVGRVFPHIGIDPLPTDDEPDQSGSRYANR